MILEADNHRLKAVLASAEPADGVEVKDLEDCGSVTFFHIALQALGMCTGSLKHVEEQKQGEEREQEQEEIEASNQQVVATAAAALAGMALSEK